MIFWVKIKLFSIVLEMISNQFLCVPLIKSKKWHASCFIFFLIHLHISVGGPWGRFRGEQLPFWQWIWTELDFGLMAFHSFRKSEKCINERRWRCLSITSFSLFAKSSDFWSSCCCFHYILDLSTTLISPFILELHIFLYYVRECTRRFICGSSTSTKYYYFHFDRETSYHIDFDFIHCSFQNIIAPYPPRLSRSIIIPRSSR